MSRILVRADGSAGMGVGHLTRCATLASELLRRGHEILFAARTLPSDFADRLQRLGFAVSMLRTPDDASPADDLAHSHWLPVTQEKDASDCLSLHPFDAVIVDHYALDARWESQVGGADCPVLAIDDFTDRAHGSQLLLNQNLVADDAYAGLVAGHTVALLGPGYALLRPEFAAERSRVRIRSSGVHRLMVFMGGGADTPNATVLALEALATDRLQTLDVHCDVVIGAGHHARGELEARCAAAGFVLHVDTPEMARIMAQADLALGAAGSATWERACLGLPTVMMCVAENQRAIAQGLERAGAGIFAGDAEALTPSTLARAVGAAARPERLRDLSAAAMRLVDGQGCRKVADALEALL